MSFVRYNKVIGLFVLPPLVLLILLAFFAEPVTGDLTRLGGHLEEDFGWHEPQLGVAQSGFKLADTLADYDGYYDIVVFGDSFSADSEKGWQNRLHERTGLSIISFSMAKLAVEAFSPSGIEVDSIVNSPQFRSHPPRYFILETVERNAAERFHLYATKPWPQDDAAQSQERAPLTFTGITPLPAHKITRDSSPDAEQKIQQAANYIAKSLNRLLGQPNKTYLFDLKQNNLFSSGRPEQLLVVAEDMEKNPTPEAVATALRGMRAVEGLVEQNGQTRFLMLIFPDKLTTYTPYLKHPEQAVPSYLPPLAVHYPLPRLDLVFQKELEGGAKDLYLPNDTHAGYLGHRLAADTLVEFYLTGQSGQTQ